MSERLYDEAEAHAAMCIWEEIIDPQLPDAGAPWDVYRELMELRGRQATTQAKLIRWCVMAITQTTEQAGQKLERERRHLKGYRSVVRMHEPAKKVREDRELALLYLQWLATQLEKGGISDEPGELDIRVEQASLNTQ